MNCIVQLDYQNIIMFSQAKEQLHLTYLLGFVVVQKIHYINT